MPEPATKKQAIDARDRGTQKEHRLAAPRDEYAARRMHKTRWIRIFRANEFVDGTVGFVTWADQREGLAARRDEHEASSALLSSGHESIESAIHAVVDDDLALRRNAARWSAEAQNWE